jgi:hypothetical protein
MVKESSRLHCAHILDPAEAPKLPEWLKALLNLEDIELYLTMGRLVLHNLDTFIKEFHAVKVEPVKHHTYKECTTTTTM